MSALASNLAGIRKTSGPKIMGPTAHGVMDYAHAAFFLGTAWCVRKSNKRAASAALGMGALLLARSALTDYRLGLKPLLPFAVHGEIDAALASLSWTIPRLCGFQGTRAASFFEAYSVVGAAVVRLTDFDGACAHAQNSSF